MTKEDKSLDLDFSEVAGEKVVKVTEAPAEVPTPEVKAEEVTSVVAPKPAVKPLGYEIALRTDEPDKYIFKDLAECTSQEFLDWLSWVYPGLQPMDPAQFESRVAKERAFNAAAQFHTVSLISMKIKDKLDKILH